MNQFSPEKTTFSLQLVQYGTYQGSPTHLDQVYVTSDEARTGLARDGCYGRGYSFCYTLVGVNSRLRICIR